MRGRGKDRLEDRVPDEGTTSAKNGFELSAHVDEGEEVFEHRVLDIIFEVGARGETGRVIDLEEPGFVLLIQKDVVAKYFKGV